MALPSLSRSRCAPSPPTMRCSARLPGARAAMWPCTCITACSGALTSRRSSGSWTSLTGDPTGASVIFRAPLRCARAIPIGIVSRQCARGWIPRDGLPMHGPTAYSGRSGRRSRLRDNDGRPAASWRVARLSGSGGRLAPDGWRDDRRSAMTEARLERLERATAELQAPFAVVALAAFWRNAADMERRAAGKPIRLASKSVRCRALQERVLARPGFQGTLAFTLPEALWLSEQGFNDVLVAYPTADREALRALACRTATSSVHAGCMEASSVDACRTEAPDEHARRTEAPDVHIALMVDSVAQLDLIESAVGPPAGAPIEVCI